MKFTMRVTKSIKIDKDLWKEVGHHCIDHDLEISGYIEGLIKKDLKK